MARQRIRCDRRVLLRCAPLLAIPSFLLMTGCGRSPVTAEGASRARLYRSLEEMREDSDLVALVDEGDRVWISQHGGPGTSSSEVEILRAGQTYILFLCLLDPAAQTIVLSPTGIWAGLYRRDPDSPDGAYLHPAHEHPTGGGDDLPQVATREKLLGLT